MKEISWADFLENPEGVLRVYGGVPPSLESADLHEVSINREGPTVRLRLDLPGYPANPPQKWRLAGFNTVQIEFLFGGVEELSVSGVSARMVVDVVIGEMGGLLSVRVDSSSLCLAVKAASISVVKFTAYVSDT